MIERIDHVNLVVEDLEGMTRFYRDVLGMTVSKEVTISGQWIDNVVGLREAIGDVVYLDAPSGPRIELIRYRQPPAKRPDLLGQSNTPGLRHLALRVSDIQTLVAKLRAGGVEFLSEVQLVPDSQVTYANNIRKRLVYFRDPEGNLLELCEYRGQQ